MRSRLGEPSEPRPVPKWPLKRSSLGCYPAHPRDAPWAQALSGRLQLRKPSKPPVVLAFLMRAPRIALGTPKSSQKSVMTCGWVASRLGMDWSDVFAVGSSVGVGVLG